MDGGVSVGPVHYIFMNVFVLFEYHQQFSIIVIIKRTGHFESPNTILYIYKKNFIILETIALEYFLKEKWKS